MDTDGKITFISKLIVTTWRLPEKPAAQDQTFYEGIIKVTCLRFYFALNVAQ